VVAQKRTGGLGATSPRPEGVFLEDASVLQAIGERRRDPHVIEAARRIVGLDSGFRVHPNGGDSVPQLGVLPAFVLWAAGLVIQVAL